MRATTRTDYVDRVRRVLRHVQEHLDEELSPDGLAQVAHFSRFHFHRVFRGLVGESLSEHVRRLRMERAAGELRRTVRNVLDIALDAGYEAHEAFTRAFRARFGVRHPSTGWLRSRSHSRTRSAECITAQTRPCHASSRSWRTRT